MGGDRAGAVAGDRSEGVREAPPDGVGPPGRDRADWRARGELLRLLWEAAPLRGLSRSALRDLAGQAREVELPAGAAVCRAGEAAEIVYLLPPAGLDGADGAGNGAGNGDGVAMVGGEVLRGAGRYERTVVARGAARGWALPARVLLGAVGAGRDGRAGAGMRIDARGLGQTARGGQRTLTDVTLAVEPGELFAIVGPSGAGKTTLLDALAGVRPAAEGTVRYDGADLRGNLAAFRAVLGYVPQDDIIHRELPLERTLGYAARLRLPAGTTSAEVDRAVREVLAALDLTGRAAVRVGSLSGGERKRASIAVELLTRPRVFFLDEPTSGLDPANAAELLRLLRRLADEGATVVLTTHNPVDVDACDTVAVLAREGNLAFAGTPGDARRHFQVRTVRDIYGRLADEADPAAWRLRFAAAPGQDAGRAGDGRGAVPGAVPGGARRGVGAARQWLLLSHRTLDILARNRLTLAILLGSPLVILLMFLMLFKPDAFSFAAPSPSTTVMILFWIAFGGFFFGLTYGLLQICNEVGVLRREAMTGLRIGPYVLSKAAVLVPLLALVDALLLGVLRWLDRLPPLGAADFGALFVTLLLASVCALGLGLLASAAVSDPSQATLMLPMLCFPQVLFVGAILPVPLMAAVGRWLSAAMSNRWAFEALGHSAGIERLWRDGASPLGPPLLAAYGDSFSRAVWVNWTILGALTAAFFIATCVVLARRCAAPAPGRRRATGARNRSEVRP
jgi:ABC-type multidrug transport system ATPase subunit